MSAGALEFMGSTAMNPRQRDAPEVDPSADIRLRDIIVQNYPQLMSSAPQLLCVSLPGLSLLACSLWLVYYTFLFYFIFFLEHVVLQKN